MQELAEAYEHEGIATKRPRLLLSAAVPAGQKIIDGGFEIAEISKYEVSSIIVTVCWCVWQSLTCI